MSPSPKNDISAVVLSVGETTTQLALYSLHRQTIAPSDVVVVRDVRPFHKALNTGAAQVKTPFFVQVDADMVLDPHCIAALRGGMDRDTGMVVGRLRDALTKQVVGIKMFRTACFADTVFRDTISPDTDFADEIERRGWKTVYIGRDASDENESWVTFGEHRPDYSHTYTFHKFVLEGHRYRHRRTIAGLVWRMSRLAASTHPAALAAQLGLAEGLFAEAEHDLLGHSAIHPGFLRYETFADPSRNCHRVNADFHCAETSPEARFQAFYRQGHALAADSPDAVRDVLGRFEDTNPSYTAWMDTIALCRGLLASQLDDKAITADFGILRDFIEACDQPRKSDASRRVRTFDLEDLKTYAAGLKLKHFITAGAEEAEYRLAGWGSDAQFVRTDRPVISRVDVDGRTRIQAPSRAFGHVLCTEPEKLAGAFWCTDLLRSGYVFAHIATPHGARRVWLPTQLIGNIRDRYAPGVAPLPGKPEASLKRLARRRPPSYRPEPRRVLMYAPSFNRGGSERQMIAAAAGLLQRGYEVQLLAQGRLPPGEPTMEDEITGLGLVPLYCSDFPRVHQAWRAPTQGSISADLMQAPNWIRDRFGAVASAIASFRPTVVHAWLDGPAVVGGLAACAMGAPRIVLSQGSMGPVHRATKPSEHMQSAYRFVASNPSVVMINNSAAGAADYERWLSVRKETIKVHYNGFMPESLRQPSGQEVVEFRGTLGLPIGAKVVGTLMRLVREKDPLLWIDTAADIARIRPDVRFLVVGYGPFHDAMLERARSHRIDDRLVLAGSMTDIGLCYAAMDVVLLTSIVEGVPNTLLEAQAAGRAVVTTDVGGAAEAVADGLTGKVVRERSSRHLAEAVVAVLDDASLLPRVQTEGPSFVAGRFGYGRMIQELVEHYRS